MTEMWIRRYRGRMVEMCGQRPSPRSSARCEHPKVVPHDQHAGRTKGGYWKFWFQPEGQASRTHTTLRRSL